jgi:hypothetical protein
VESRLFKVCFPLENFELNPVEEVDIEKKKPLKTFWKNTHNLQAMESNHKFKDS